MLDWRNIKEVWSQHSLSLIFLLRGTKCYIWCWKMTLWASGPPPPFEITTLKHLFISTEAFSDLGQGSFLTYTKNQQKLSVCSQEHTEQNGTGETSTYKVSEKQALTRSHRNNYVGLSVPSGTSKSSRNSCKSKRGVKKIWLYFNTS